MKTVDEWITVYCNGPRESTLNGLIDAIQTDAREPLLSALKENLVLLEKIMDFRRMCSSGLIEDKEITDAIARIKEHLK